jgi:hypothetical protein
MPIFNFFSEHIPATKVENAVHFHLDLQMGSGCRLMAKIALFSVLSMLEVR